MAQSSITLQSPDGSKTVILRLENDGYLHKIDGTTGETMNATRVREDADSEPQNN